MFQNLGYISEVIKIAIITNIATFFSLRYKNSKFGQLFRNDMKKLNLQTIVVLLLIFSQSVLGQDFFNGEFNHDKKYLLLAHPTVQNLKTILFLTEKGIFDIGDAGIVAVYHHDENYDFKQSIDFVNKEQLKNIHFQEVKAHLEIPDMYNENPCTNEFKTLFSHSAGIIFFGGPDISPEAYNEENLHSIVTDPYRHVFELSLLFHLLGGSQSPGFVPFLDEKPDYLVTGFCLGMQTMNVATGGSLIQDIPAQVYNLHSDQEIVALPKNDLHRNYWQNISSDSLLMGINFHRIRFEGDDFFRKRVGSHRLVRPKVLSSHHQSVNKVGQGWQITAFSRDGKIVEAFRHEKYPNVYAVQFHPEVPALYENRMRLKFSPDDKPRTYHQILGKRSLKFHLQYWQCISDALKDAMN